MNNQNYAHIRRQAKQIALSGHYQFAIKLLDESIREEQRTFDDLLFLNECLILSKAWLQAECVADIINQRRTTPKQEKRFKETQKRLNPPHLTDIIKGRQFGGKWHPRRSLEPG